MYRQEQEREKNLYVIRIDNGEKDDCGSAGEINVKVQGKECGECKLKERNWVSSTSTMGAINSLIRIVMQDREGE